MFNRYPIVFVSAVLAALVVSASLPCQRQVKQLTKRKEPHFDAQISPNGTLVAFKGKQKIGIVDVGGNKETDVATGTGLGSFVWAPNNSGLYFLDGTTVKFVPKNGGTPSTIGTGKGTMILGCVDRTDKAIYGTRRDSNGNWYVFSLATSGSASPQDIVSIASNHWVEGVCVDFANKKLAYFVSLQGVHKPKDLLVADVDGKNEKSWSGGQKLQPATRNLAWADAGTTVVFTTIVGNPQITWQLARLTAATTTPQYLTGAPRNHQRSATSGNLSWIVMEAETVGSRKVPAVIPSAGGGRVPLEPERDWVFQGDPSMDLAAKKVAFAASFLDEMKKLTISQVYLIELDREVVVTPRAVPGGNVDIKLPVEKGERGMLFLSIGLIQKPVPIVGFTYGIAINTNAMALMLTGVGDGNGPLQLKNVAVPNDSKLTGVEVFLQGIRSPDGRTGDLTRYVELQIQ